MRDLWYSLHSSRTSKDNYRCMCVCVRARDDDNIVALSISDALQVESFTSLPLRANINMLKRSYRSFLIFNN